MTEQNLEQTAAALKDARQHLNRCLVLCAAYVGKAAATDPEAAELHRLTQAAFDTNAAEGIMAATVVTESRSGATS